MKPCLKQRTHCVIIREDGRRYEATNSAMLMPSTCARA